MGGPSGGNSGSADAPNTTRSKVSVKSKAKIAAKNVVDFVKGGGVVGAVARSINKSYQSKNKTSKSGDVYGGEAYGYNEAAEKRDYNPRSTLSNRGNDRDGPSQKSIEQPKVASQMDNTDVKSDLITAKGPTSVEMSEDDILLQNKRKGRKRTVLTSVTGVQGYPTLSKKTLLGG
jgi:hypothetical protein